MAGICHADQNQCFRIDGTPDRFPEPRRFIPEVILPATFKTVTASACLVVILMLTDRSSFNLAGISIFNFTFAQKHMRAPLLLQAQIAMAAMGGGVETGGDSAYPVNVDGLLRKIHPPQEGLEAGVGAEVGDRVLIRLP